MIDAVTGFIVRSFKVGNILPCFISTQKFVTLQ